MIHQHQNGDEGQAVLRELDRIHKKKPVDLSALRVAYCFSFPKSCLPPTPQHPLHPTNLHITKRLLHAKNEQRLLIPRICANYMRLPLSKPLHIGHALCDSFSRDWTKKKPSTITRVLVGWDADSAFIAAINEKERAEKHKLTFEGFFDLVHPQKYYNFYNPTLYSHYSLPIFLFTFSPIALTPHHSLFHTGKRGLVTSHQ